jgi:hypothetical protein
MNVLLGTGQDLVRSKLRFIALEVKALVPGAYL